MDEIITIKVATDNTDLEKTADALNKINEIKEHVESFKRDASSDSKTNTAVEEMFGKTYDPTSLASGIDFVSPLIENMEKQMSAFDSYIHTASQGIQNFLSGITSRTQLELNEAITSVNTLYGKGKRSIRNAEKGSWNADAATDSFYNGFINNIGSTASSVQKLAYIQALLNANEIKGASNGVFGVTNDELMQHMDSISSPVLAKAKLKVAGRVGGTASMKDLASDIVREQDVQYAITQAFKGKTIEKHQAEKIVETILLGKGPSNMFNFDIGEIGTDSSGKITFGKITNTANRPLRITPTITDVSSKYGDLTELILNRGVNKSFGTAKEQQITQSTWEAIQRMADEDDSYTLRNILLQIGAGAQESGRMMYKKSLSGGQSRALIGLLAKSAHDAQRSMPMYDADLRAYEEQGRMVNRNSLEYNRAKEALDLIRTDSNYETMQKGYRDDADIAAIKKADGMSKDEIRAEGERYGRDPILRKRRTIRSHGYEKQLTIPNAHFRRGKFVGLNQYGLEENIDPEWKKTDGVEKNIETDQLISLGNSQLMYMLQGTKAGRDLKIDDSFGAGKDETTGKSKVVSPLLISFPLASIATRKDSKGNLIVSNDHDLKKFLNREESAQFEYKGMPTVPDEEKNFSFGYFNGEQGIAIQTKALEEMDRSLRLRGLPGLLEMGDAEGIKKNDYERNVKELNSVHRIATPGVRFVDLGIGKKKSPTTGKIEEDGIVPALIDNEALFDVLQEQGGFSSDKAEAFKKKHLVDSGILIDPDTGFRISSQIRAAGADIKGMAQSDKFRELYEIAGKIYAQNNSGQKLVDLGNNGNEVVAMYAPMMAAGALADEVKLATKSLATGKNYMINEKGEVNSVLGEDLKTKFTTSAMGDTLSQDQIDYLREHYFYNIFEKDKKKDYKYGAIIDKTSAKDAPKQSYVSARQYANYLYKKKYNKNLYSEISEENENEILGELIANGTRGITSDKTRVYLNKEEQEDYFKNKLSAYGGFWSATEGSDFTSSKNIIPYSAIDNLYVSEADRAKSEQIYRRRRSELFTESGRRKFLESSANGARKIAQDKNWINSPEAERLVQSELLAFDEAFALGSLFVENDEASIGLAKAAPYEYIMSWLSGIDTRNGQNISREEGIKNELLKNPDALSKGLAHLMQDFNGKKFGGKVFTATDIVKPGETIQAMLDRLPAAAGENSAVNVYSSKISEAKISEAENKELDINEYNQYIHKRRDPNVGKRSNNGKIKLNKREAEEYAVQHMFENDEDANSALYALWYLGEDLSSGTYTNVGQMNRLNTADYDGDTVWLIRLGEETLLQNEKIKNEMERRRKEKAKNLTKQPSEKRTMEEVGAENYGDLVQLSMVNTILAKNAMGAGSKALREAFTLPDSDPRKLDLLIEGMDYYDAATSDVQYGGKQLQMSEAMSKLVSGKNMTRRFFAQLKKAGDNGLEGDNLFKTIIGSSVSDYGSVQLMRQSQRSTQYFGEDTGGYASAIRNYVATNYDVRTAQGKAALLIGDIDRRVSTGRGFITKKDVDLLREYTEQMKRDSMDSRYSMQDQKRMSSNASRLEKELDAIVSGDRYTEDAAKRAIDNLDSEINTDRNAFSDKDEFDKLIKDYYSGNIVLTKDELNAGETPFTVLEKRLKALDHDKDYKDFKPLAQKIHQRRTRQEAFDTAKGFEESEEIHNFLQKESINDLIRALDFADKAELESTTAEVNGFLKEFMDNKTRNIEKIYNNSQHPSHSGTHLEKFLGDEFNPSALKFDVIDVFGNNPTVKGRTAKNPSEEDIRTDRQNMLINDLLGKEAEGSQNTIIGELLHAAQEAKTRIDNKDIDSSNTFGGVAVSELIDGGKSKSISDIIKILASNGEYKDELSKYGITYDQATNTWNGLKDTKHYDKSGLRNPYGTSEDSKRALLTAVTGDGSKLGTPDALDEYLVRVGQYKLAQEGKGLNPKDKEGFLTYNFSSNPGKQPDTQMRADLLTFSLDPSNSDSVLFHMYDYKSSDFSSQRSFGQQYIYKAILDEAVKDTAVAEKIREQVFASMGGTTNPAGFADASKINIFSKDSSGKILGLNWGSLNGFSMSSGEISSHTPTIPQEELTGLIKNAASNLEKYIDPTEDNNNFVDALIGAARTSALIKNFESMQNGKGPAFSTEALKLLGIADADQNSRDKISIRSKYLEQRKRELDEMDEKDKERIMNVPYSEFAAQKFAKDIETINDLQSRQNKLLSITRPKTYNGYDKFSSIEKEISELTTPEQLIEFRDRALLRGDRAQAEILTDAINSERKLEEVTSEMREKVTSEELKRDIGSLDKILKGTDGVKKASFADNFDSYLMNIYNKEAEAEGFKKSEVTNSTTGKKEARYNSTSKTFVDTDDETVYNSMIAGIGNLKEKTGDVFKKMIDDYISKIEDGFSEGPDKNDLGALIKDSNKKIDKKFQDKINEITETIDGENGLDSQINKLSKKIRDKADIGENVTKDVSLLSVLQSSKVRLETERAKLESDKKAATTKNEAKEKEDFLRESIADKNFASRFGDFGDIDSELNDYEAKAKLNERLEKIYERFRKGNSDYAWASGLDIDNETKRRDFIDNYFSNNARLSLTGADSYIGKIKKQNDLIEDLRGLENADLRYRSKSLLQNNLGLDVSNFKYGITGDAISDDTIESMARNKELQARIESMKFRQSVQYAFDKGIIDQAKKDELDKDLDLSDSNIDSGKFYDKTKKQLENNNEAKESSRTANGFSAIDNAYSFRDNLTGKILNERDYVASRTRQDYASYYKQLADIDMSDMSDSDRQNAKNALLTGYREIGSADYVKRLRNDFKFNQEQNSINALTSSYGLKNNIFGYINKDDYIRQNYLQALSKKDELEKQLNKTDKSSSLYYERERELNIIKSQLDRSSGGQSELEKRLGIAYGLNASTQNASLMNDVYGTYSSITATKDFSKYYAAKKASELSHINKMRNDINNDQNMSAAEKTAQNNMLDDAERSISNGSFGNRLSSIFDSDLYSAEYNNALGLHNLKQSVSGIKLTDEERLDVMYNKQMLQLEQMRKSLLEQGKDPNSNAKFKKAAEDLDRKGGGIGSSDYEKNVAKRQIDYENTLNKINSDYSNYRYEQQLSDINRGRAGHYSSGIVGRAMRARDNEITRRNNIKYSLNKDIEEAQYIMDTNDSTSEIYKNAQKKRDNLTKLQTENENAINNLNSNGISRNIFDQISASLDGLIFRLGRQGLRKAFQEAVRFTKEFDQQMTNIQMITEKSDSEMTSVRSATISKAKNLKTSISNVSQVESSLYRQGLSDSEVSSRTDAIVKFATVTGAKVGNATKALTTAIQNGLVNSVEEAMDALTALGDSAATTAEEIFKGMQKSAAAAADAGVSYEELTSMLTVITSKTQLSGSSAGSALNTILNRMNRVSKEGFVKDLNGESTSINDVETALNYAGVNLRDDKGSFRNTTEVLRDLASVWETLSDIQQNSVTYALAGTRQANMFSSLMAGLGEDGGEEFNRLLELAKNSSGITERKYETYEESLAASREYRNAAFDSLIASTTDGGIAKGFNNVAGDVMNTMASGAEKTSGISSILGGAAGLGTGFWAAGATTAAMTKAGGALGSIAGPVGTIAGIAAGLLAGVLVSSGFDLLPESEAQKRQKENELSASVTSGYGDRFTSAYSAFKTLESIDVSNFGKGVSIVEEFRSEINSLTSAIPELGGALNSINLGNFGSTIENAKEKLQNLMETAVIAITVTRSTDDKEAYEKSINQIRVGTTQGNLGDQSFWSDALTSTHSALFPFGGSRTTDGHGNKISEASFDYDGELFAYLDHSSGLSGINYGDNEGIMRSLMLRSLLPKAYNMDEYISEGTRSTVASSIAQFLSSESGRKFAESDPRRNKLTFNNGVWNFGTNNVISKNDLLTEENLSDNDIAQSAINIILGSADAFNSYVSFVKDNNVTSNEDVANSLLTQAIEGYTTPFKFILDGIDVNLYDAFVSSIVKKLYNDDGTINFDVATSTQAVDKLIKEEMKNANGSSFLNEEDRFRYIIEHSPNKMKYKMTIGDETYYFSSKDFDQIQQEYAWQGGTDQLSYDEIVGQGEKGEGLQINTDSGGKAFVSANETVKALIASRSSKDQGYKDQYTSLLRLAKKNDSKNIDDLSAAMGVTFDEFEGTIQNNPELLEIWDSLRIGDGKYSWDQFMQVLEKSAYGKTRNEMFADIMKTSNNLGSMQWFIGSGKDSIQAREAIMQQYGLTRSQYESNSDFWKDMYKKDYDSSVDTLETSVSDFANREFGDLFFEYDKETGKYTGLADGFIKKYGIIKKDNGKYGYKGKEYKTADELFEKFPDLENIERKDLEQLKATEDQLDWFDKIKAQGGSISFKKGKLYATINGEEIAADNAFINWDKKYTSGEKLSLAQKIYSSGSDWKKVTSQMQLAGEDLEQIKQQYPELYEYMNLSGEQQSSQYGQNLKRNIELNFQLSGIQELEEAGTIISGISSAIETIKKSDIFTSEAAKGNLAGDVRTKSSGIEALDRIMSSGKGSSEDWAAVQQLLGWDQNMLDIYQSNPALLQSVYGDYSQKAKETLGKSFDTIAMNSIGINTGKYSYYKDKDTGEYIVTDVNGNKLKFLDEQSAKAEVDRGNSYLEQANLIALKEGHEKIDGYMTTLGAVWSDTANNGNGGYEHNPELARNYYDRTYSTASEEAAARLEAGKSISDSDYYRRMMKYDSSFMTTILGAKTIDDITNALDSNQLYRAILQPTMTSEEYVEATRNGNVKKTQQILMNSLFGFSLEDSLKQLGGYQEALTQVGNINASFKNKDVEAVSSYLGLSNSEKAKLIAGDDEAWKSAGKRIERKNKELLEPFEDIVAALADKFGVKDLSGLVSELKSKGGEAGSAIAEVIEGILNVLGIEIEHVKILNGQVEGMTPEVPSGNGAMEASLASKKAELAGDEKSRNYLNSLYENVSQYGYAKGVEMTASQYSDMTEGDYEKLYQFAPGLQSAFAKDFNFIKNTDDAGSVTSTSLVPSSNIHSDQSGRAIISAALGYGDISNEVIAGEYMRNFISTEGYFDKNGLMTEKGREAFTTDYQTNPEFAQAMSSYTQYVDAIKNADDLEDATESFRELGEEIGNNFVKKTNKFGNSTDKILGYMDLFSSDAEKSTEAAKSLNSQLSKMRIDKYYRDMYRNGNRDSKTLESIAEQTGRTKESLSGKDILPGLEMELNNLDLKDDKVISEIATAFETDLNNYFQNSGIEIGGAFDVSIDSTGNISIPEDFSTLPQEVQAKIMEKANELASMGLSGHIVSTANGDSFEISVQLDSLEGGKPGGGGGGGGKKSAAQKLLEKIKHEDEAREHRRKMIQIEQSKYEANGQLGNYGLMLEEEKAYLEGDYSDQLNDKLKRLETQLSKTKKHSDDWYSLRDEIQKVHEEISQTTVDIEELNNKIKENRSNMRQTRIDLESTVVEAIESFIEKERSMVEGAASMEDTLVNIIRNRYQEEWDLIQKDIEKKRQALEEEKSLIDERLQARKDAEDEANKYSELEQLKAQLAYIQADTTRTKDAIELREKIAKLQGEISWDLAEDDAKRTQQSLDDQLEAYDEYSSYGEEQLANYLEDANNFASEVSELMKMTQEDLLAWLQENDDNFLNSLQSTQQSMLYSWIDIYKQMYGIVDTYWDQVEEILKSKDSFIEFMKTTDEYIYANDTAQQEELVYQWGEQYDTWDKTRLENAVFEHLDNFEDIGTSGGKKKSKNGSKKTEDESKKTEDEMVTYLEPIGPQLPSESDGFIGPPLPTYGPQLPAGPQLPKDYEKDKKKYAKGGLVDYTGLAWVDGTFSNPESFLDATDTEMLLKLTEALTKVSVSGFTSYDTSSIGNNNNISNTIGDITINIDNSDENMDYEALAERIGERFALELSKQGFSTANYSF